MTNTQSLPIQNLLVEAEQHTKNAIKNSKEKGEGFNLFSLMDIEKREVKTHSAFIAELLNPKGRHEMGSSFLEEFLKILRINEEFDFTKTQVYVEYHVKEYGRLDILISDQKNFIAIENKIDAGDQKAQLLRYHKWLQANNRQINEHQLIYLTLDGKEASEYSTGGKDFKYDCVSYQNDIHNWLEKCIHLAKEKECVKNAIEQYLFLIKKLTGQLNDQKMEKEIKDLIKKNLLGAQQIEKLFWDTIKEEIIGFSELINEMLNKEKFKECYFSWGGKKGKGNSTELVLWISKNDNSWIGVANGKSNKFYIAKDSSWNGTEGKDWRYFNEDMKIVSFNTKENLEQIQLILKNPNDFKNEAIKIAEEVNQFCS